MWEDTIFNSEKTWDHGLDFHDSHRCADQVVSLRPQNGFTNCFKILDKPAMTVLGIPLHAYDGQRKSSVRWSDEQNNPLPIEDINDLRRSELSKASSLHPSNATLIQTHSLVWQFSNLNLKLTCNLFIFTGRKSTEGKDSTYHKKTQNWTQTLENISTALRVKEFRINHIHR